VSSGFNLLKSKKQNIKNILVTGGAGFIGSHVCDVLIGCGYNVIVVDNLSCGFESQINPKASFYNMDINSPKLQNVFDENGIDAVFHFAAQASVGFSTKFPICDAESNIMGTLNLLSLCKKYKIKKLIASSTAAVYGVPKYLPVDENHGTECLSFYGLSKLTMEKYVELFGVDYIILRLANVYGPRQSASGEAGVVAIFADRMNKKEDVIIHGDGTQTRDFISVFDVSKACLCALESDVKNEIINISTEEAVSIKELFEVMSAQYAYGKSPVYSEPREGDIKDSILKNEKCKRLLGFSPLIALNEGITALK